MTANTISAYGFTGFLGRGAALRELQCLMAVAAGRTSKEAAREMGVTPDSIDKRLLSLTTKLGVKRRAAMVAEAFKRQIISPMLLVICVVMAAQAVSTDQYCRVRRPSEGRVTVRRAESFPTA